MNGISRNSKGVVRETKKAKTQEKETQNRLCDLCGEESKAILYCRADEAKICLNCDSQVHSSNQLFTKHTRSLLCDSCDSSPCSIFCSNHDLVLCQNCDWERHGSVSLLHERRPLDGFIGCPSVTELLVTFGIQDLGQERKNNGGKDCGFDDYLIWDTSSMVGLDDLIISDGSNHNFMATGVPSLPKNPNTVCGQHKNEIICQLRRMAKLEPNFEEDHQYDNETSCFHDSLALKDNCPQKDAYFDLEQNMEATYFPSYGPTALISFSPGEGAGKELSDRKSNTGQSLHQRNNGQEIQVDGKIFPKVTPHQYSSQERQDVLARYKEKKKCRRYEKQIRYEAHKIHAKNRARIRDVLLEKITNNVFNNRNCCSPSGRASLNNSKKSSLR